MSDTMATPSHEPGPAPPVVAGEEGAGGQPQEPRFRLKPTHLAYLMGPVAFVALLLLMRFHLIVHESVWLWVSETEFSGARPSEADLVWTFT